MNFFFLRFFFFFVALILLFRAHSKHTVSSSLSHSLFSLVRDDMVFFHLVQTGTVYFVQYVFQSNDTGDLTGIFISISWRVLSHSLSARQYQHLRCMCAGLLFFFSFSLLLRFVAEYALNRFGCPLPKSKSK